MRDGKSLGQEVTVCIIGVVAFDVVVSKMAAELWITPSFDHQWVKCDPFSGPPGISPMVWFLWTCCDTYRSTHRNQAELPPWVILLLPGPNKLQNSIQGTLAHGWSVASRGTNWEPSGCQQSEWSLHPWSHWVIPANSLRVPTITIWLKGGGFAWGQRTAAESPSCREREAWGIREVTAGGDKDILAASFEQKRKHRWVFMQRSGQRVSACVPRRSSHVQLFATPWTVIRKAPLSMGFSRQEYWRRLPCPSPGDLPNPGIEPTSLMSPALADGFFTTSPTWRAGHTRDLGLGWVPGTRPWPFMCPWGKIHKKKRMIKMLGESTGDATS